MIEANVIGRQRHPRAVRFGNRSGNALGLQYEVLCAAKDARLRVSPIFEAEEVGRILGKHHDAPHTGR